jgi:hypothetical protein
MSLSTYTIEQIADMRQRRVCTKSHYKMTCSCCGKTIHRGDEITQVVGIKGRLRTRAVEFTETKLARPDDPYIYMPTRNRWVHLTCRPQHFQTWGWSPGYNAGFTAYSQNLDRRIAVACFDPDWGEDIANIPHPDWTWQTDRLSEAIIPLQRMVKRKKWKKQVFDAVTMLDKANEEVIYKWQNDHMYQVSGYLRLHFPRPPINPACRQYSPPCNEEYRISWLEVVTKAVRTLDHMYCNWKFDWQLEIFKQLRKKYAK